MLYRRVLVLYHPLYIQTYVNATSNQIELVLIQYLGIIIGHCTDRINKKAHLEKPIRLDYRLTFVYPRSKNHLFIG